MLRNIVGKEIFKGPFIVVEDLAPNIVLVIYRKMSPYTRIV